MIVYIGFTWFTEDPVKNPALIKNSEPLEIFYTEGDAKNWVQDGIINVCGTPISSRVYKPFKVPTGISPVCRKCLHRLNDFGGLLFSSPINTDIAEISTVKKSHLCERCYDLVCTYIDYGPDNAELTKDLKVK